MGIRDRPTSFRSPWQNGYVERLIGSIRRECTDHLIVFNAAHLRRNLAKYASYYNEVRTHVSLGKDAPCRRPIERFGAIVSYPILGGLHHVTHESDFSEGTGVFEPNRNASYPISPNEAECGPRLTSFLDENDITRTTWGGCDVERQSCGAGE
jgi:hypothetical protein